MAYSSVIAKRLGVVQKNVMSMSFESLTLDSVLPIIFEECLRENMIFYFSFVENYAILNLRSVNEKHDELNIRQYYETTPEIETLKLNLLINTFLIIPKSVKTESDNEASSAKKITKENTEHKITMGNTVPPTAIRTVIEVLEKNNEPVNSKTIEKHLQLSKMSQDNRRRCIAYLRDLKKREASA